MYNSIEGGRVEEIQGLRCWIPPVPDLKTIQGYFLAEKDQKWARTELPEFDQLDVEIVSGSEYPKGYKLSWDEAKREEVIKQTGYDPFDMSKNPKIIYQDYDQFYINEKMEEFRQQENDRIDNGFWFMCKGKPVFITGYHYFYLTWWKLNTGYPNFRDTDRKLFYFWQYCKEDQFCYGLIEITKRGQGKSYRVGSVGFLENVRYKGSHVGIQSKNDEDAGTFFKTKVVEPMKELPEFMIPINNHGTEPQSGLSWFPPSRKTLNARYIKRQDAIRSWMDFRSATNNAYDSCTCKFIVEDEIAKIEPKIGDAQKRIGICKDVVFRDNKMIGKIWATSTVEDMEKGGDSCHIVYRQSDLSKRSENGYTVSGLYPFFLSAIECTIFDEYGYPDVIAAKKKHNAERKNLEGDSLGYTLYIQKNPYTIEEAFRTSGKDCIYNARILTEREQMCNEFRFTSVGNFEWVNGKPFTKVEFVHNESGKWEISWLFPFDKDANQVAEGLFINGKKTYSPKNNHKFAIGYDPFSHASTSFEKRRSNAGGAVYRMSDFWDQDNSDTYVADYVDRPDNPNDAHMEILKACWYYGCQALCESQKNSFFEFCKQSGCYDFVMWRPDSTMPATKGASSTEGVPSSSPVISQYVDAGKTHIHTKGYKLKHLRIIKDYLKFDPSKRYKFDLGVASQLVLLAADRPLEEVHGYDKDNDSFGAEAIYG